MFNYKLIPLLKALCLLVIFSSTGVFAEQTRSNELIMTFINDNIPFIRLININFKIKDHIETQPNTYEGVSSEIMDINKGKITVNVGRKGSTAVANKFNDWVTHEGRNVFGKKPDKLNFAVQGDLELTLDVFGKQQTVVYRDFVIAQGHTGAVNNWWAGSPGCKHGVYVYNPDSLPRKSGQQRSMTCLGQMHMQFMRYQFDMNGIYMIPRDVF
ncbi:hypothetical protein [Endozoicomonas sp.]|uniref:hypothetical protein n=1 Tax=Endozoicomonas sp. TaxID=1892382 RepID=UPI0028870828|nr:hypothetical protein [Endozoicomonas sp.]